MLIDWILLEEESFFFETTNELSDILCMRLENMLHNLKADTVNSVRSLNQITI